MLMFSSLCENNLPEIYLILILHKHEQIKNFVRGPD